MDAEIHTLYSSELCTVHNFLCKCQHCAVSKTEYQESLSLAYVRRGNFIFKTFKNDLDAHHGLFLICKPGYEYRVGHVHDMPDQCTIFSLSAENQELLVEQHGAFSSFFQNPDKHSILVNATPETEYLHYALFNSLSKKHFPKLWIEQMMTELFSQVLSSPGSQTLYATLNERQKRHYLPVIESVKEFINENYTEDISLSQLADTGNLSPYHFNRLFKQITSVTPYHYLLRVRLHQAQLQLRHTSLTVTTVAFSSGFNSLEHFSAAYKNQFGEPPSAARA